MTTCETQMVDARWYVYASRQEADDNLGKILIGRILYRMDLSPVGMYRAYYIQSEVLGEEPSLFGTLVESERWIQQRWEKTLEMRAHAEDRYVEVQQKKDHHPDCELCG